MEATLTDILCRQCGSPFPRERGKIAVVCPACGRLRPDLDGYMSHSDMDAVPLSPNIDGPDATHVAVAPSLRPAPVPNRNRAAEFFTVGRPMAPRPDNAVTQRSTPGNRSLSEQLSPVLIAIMPLAIGQGCALMMLNAVPDFSAGSWIAVGVVFLLSALASLLAGMLISSVARLCGMRSPLLIRLVFVTTTLAIGYVSLNQFPTRVIVRENDLPGFRL